MQIETRKIQWTKGEYVAIHVSKLLKKRIPVFAAIAALAAYLLFSFDFHPIFFIVLITVILYPSLLIIYVWRFASSPENKIINEKRRYVFSDDFIKCYLDNGSYSEMRYGHVTRVAKSAKHYDLKLSKTQSILIPFRAFQSPEDRDAFDTLLRSKLL